MTEIDNKDSEWYWVIIKGEEKSLGKSVNSDGAIKKFNKGLTEGMYPDVRKNHIITLLKKNGSEKIQNCKLIIDEIDGIRIAKQT